MKIVFMKGMPRAGASNKKVVKSSSYMNDVRGDDTEATADLLEGRMDLTIILPSGQGIKRTVDRRTPMMDLLIQVSTANSINPGGHVLHVFTGRGDDFLHYKPSTPIGALDASTIHIVPKSRIIDPTSATPSSTSFRAAALRGCRLPGLDEPKQPFEQTFRLQVNLPKNQFAVLRVGAATKLADVKRKVCREKNLDPVKYNLYHSVNLDEPLDESRSVIDYDISEVSLVPVNQSASVVVSRSDIGAMSSNASTMSSTYKSKSSMGESSASSDSLDDIATARSLSPPFSTAGEPEPPPGAGARPRAPPRCKKRPAPAPPPALVRQSVDSPVSGSGSHHARNLAQALVLADEDARSDISAAASSVGFPDRKQKTSTPKGGEKPCTHHHHHHHHGEDEPGSHLTNLTAIPSTSLSSIASSIPPGNPSGVPAPVMPAGVLRNNSNNTNKRQKARAPAPPPAAAAAAPPPPSSSSQPPSSSCTAPSDTPPLTSLHHQQHQQEHHQQQQQQSRKQERLVPPMQEHIQMMPGPAAGVSDKDAVDGRKVESPAPSRTSHELPALTSTPLPGNRSKKLKRSESFRRLMKNIFAWRPGRKKKKKKQNPDNPDFEPDMPPSEDDEEEEDDDEDHTVADSGSDDDDDDDCSETGSELRRRLESKALVVVMSKPAPKPRRSLLLNRHSVAKVSESHEEEEDDEQQLHQQQQGLDKSYEEEEEDENDDDESSVSSSSGSESREESSSSVSRNMMSVRAANVGRLLAGYSSDSSDAYEDALDDDKSSVEILRSNYQKTHSMSSEYFDAECGTSPEQPAPSPPLQGLPARSPSLASVASSTSSTFASEFAISLQREEKERRRRRKQLGQEDPDQETVFGSNELGFSSSSSASSSTSTTTSSIVIPSIVGSPMTVTMTKTSMAMIEWPSDASVVAVLPDTVDDRRDNLSTLGEPSVLPDPPTPFKDSFKPSVEISSQCEEDGDESDEELKCLSSPSPGPTETDYSVHHHQPDEEEEQQLQKSEAPAAVAVLDLPLIPPPPLLADDNDEEEEKDVVGALVVAPQAAHVDSDEEEKRDRRDSTVSTSSVDSGSTARSVRSGASTSSSMSRSSTPPPLPKTPVPPPEVVPVEDVGDNGVVSVADEVELPVKRPDRHDMAVQATPANIIGFTISAYGEEDSDSLLNRKTLPVAVHATSSNDAGVQAGDDFNFEELPVLDSVPVGFASEEPVLESKSDDGDEVEETTRKKNVTSVEIWARHSDVQPTKQEEVIEVPFVVRRISPERTNQSLPVLSCLGKRRPTSFSEAVGILDQAGCGGKSEVLPLRIASQLSDPSDTVSIDGPRVVSKESIILTGSSSMILPSPPLQSVELMRGLLPQISQSLTHLNVAEDKEPEAPVVVAAEERRPSTSESSEPSELEEEVRRYSYQGPPKISLASWQDRKPDKHVFAKLKTKDIGGATSIQGPKIVEPPKSFADEAIPTPNTEPKTESTFEKNAEKKLSGTTQVSEGVSIRDKVKMLASRPSGDAENTKDAVPVLRSRPVSFIKPSVPEEASGQPSWMKRASYIASSYAKAVQSVPAVVVTTTAAPATVAEPPPPKFVSPPPKVVSPPPKVISPPPKVVTPTPPPPKVATPTPPPPPAFYKPKPFRPPVQKLQQQQLPPAPAKPSLQEEILNEFMVKSKEMKQRNGWTPTEVTSVKPPVVVAVMEKQDVASSAPAPPPPPPTAPASWKQQDTTNVYVTRTGKKIVPARNVPVQADPRNDLLSAIRTHGGRGNLKKVTTTSWNNA